MQIKYQKGRNDFAGYNDDQIMKHLKSIYTNDGIEPEVTIDGDEIILTINEPALAEAMPKFDKAMSLCASHKLDAAEKLLKEIIVSCPKFSEAYRALGQVSKEKGNLSLAVDYCIDALRFNKKNEWAYILMGNIMLQKNNLDAAEKYFSDILEFNGDNSIAISNLGFIKLRKCQYAESEEYFKKAIEIDESYLNAYYGLTFAYAQQEKFTDAYRIATRGLNVGEDRPQNRGVREELRKALEAISNTIDAIPDDEREMEMAKYRMEHPDGEDPQETMMMAMLMECALEELSPLPLNVQKTVAMQIAQQGLRGIRPSEEGYRVPFFKDRDFNGYTLIAYYYVSWKLAFPEDVDKLGLPYKKAYLAAKKRFDNKNKK